MPGYASETAAKIAIGKNRDWAERDATVLPFTFGATGGVSFGLDALNQRAETRYAVVVRDVDTQTEVASAEPEAAPAPTDTAGTNAEATGPRGELIAELRKQGEIAEHAVSVWVDRFGLEGARVLAEAGYGRDAVFTIIGREISPNKELMDAVSKDTDLANVWAASQEAVKALDEPAFAALLASGGAGKGKQTNKYGYLVLRHSNEKAEIDYVRSLGRMKYNAAEAAQAPGGRLHSMAQPYIKQQQAATETGASEAATTGTNAVYLVLDKPEAAAGEWAAPVVQSKDDAATSQQEAPAEQKEAEAEAARADFPLKEAVASYSGISHSGSSRAKADADEFQAYMEAAMADGNEVARSEAQKAAVATAANALRADYLAAYRKLMAVRAGTYSGYVAGRSGLNSKQADKRNSAYDNALDTFIGWQKANKGRLRRAALSARTSQEVAADVAERESAAREKAERIRAADLGLIRKVLSWKKGGEPVTFNGSSELIGVNYSKDGYPTSLKLKPLDGSTLTDDRFDLAQLFRNRAEGESAAAAAARVRELVDAARAEAPAVKESLTAERAGADEIAAIYAAEMAAQYGNSAEVGDMHRDFARAVTGKDGYALKFLSNGMNDAAKRAFTKVTGVALPKGQGATWDAIKSWAGITAEQDAERETKQREQTSAERSKKEAEAVTRAAERVVVDGEQNGREWVDSLIERGFNSLVTKKVGAATQYWLINSDTDGFNLTSMRGAGDALWKYAKQIVGAESHADYSDRVRSANQSEKPAGSVRGDQGTKDAAAFIDAPGGGIDFGEISPEAAEVIGRQPGKIRLQQGDDSFGLTHIEGRHGDQIRALGYSSVEAFVSDVVNSPGAIYQAGGGALYLAKEAKPFGMAIIRLEPAADGDFYAIRTATPTRQDQFKNKEPLYVFAGPSKQSAEADPLNPKGKSSSPSQSIAPAQESSKAKSKPEAWGEKVAGAARDRVGKARAALDKDLGDNVSKWKLSDAMPDLDYEKLAADGVPVDNLIAYRAARDTVPIRPTRGVLLRRWGQLVEAMRNTGRILLEGNVDANEVMRGLSGGNSALGDRFKLYQALGLELMQKAKGVTISDRSEITEWSATDGQSTRTGHTVRIDGKELTLSNGFSPIVFQDYDAAVDAVRKALQQESAATPTGTKGPKLGVSSYKRARSDGKQFLITMEKSGTLRPLKDGFATRDEAQAYLDANREQLEAVVKEAGQLREVRGSSNRPRIGKSRASERYGLEPKDFAAKFGFRSVDFGNSMPYDERQGHLDRTHDALMDLAELMNVPPAALGLNGRLAIAFGSRGRGGKDAAAAHYEPDMTVINLTRNNGAGSLAHEWFHALDNYFAKHVGSINDSGAFATTYAATQLKSNGIRPEVADAFVGIIKAVERSGMAKRSEELDSYRSKPYWATKVEMAARAFEAWVKFTLEANGLSNDYLANIGSNMGGSDTLAAVLSGAWPYPTFEELRGIGDSEGQGIAGAVQQLANSLRTEEVTHPGGSKTTRLFSKYNRFAAPGTAAITGMTRPQAELAIAQFLKEYSGAAGVRVNVATKQGDVRGLPSKADEVVRAFYSDGEVTVVLENIANSAQLKSILRHEVLAHHGLRSIVSDADHKAIIQAVLNSEKAKGPLAEVWRTVRANYDGDSDARLAEEVIAHVAENTDQTGLGLYWERVTGLITRALRAIGLLPKGEISRTEIRELIRSIGEGMKQGAGRDVNAYGGGMASKAAAPDVFTPDRDAAERYRSDLTKTMRSLRTNPEVIKVGRTPYVMTRFGAPDLELVIRKDTIAKATNKVKDQHDVPMDVIERLPELLADPVAVLDDSGKFPAQVVIVDAVTDGGRPVSVAVHLRVREGRAEVNRISSAYGKDNFKRMTLEYLEKGKNPDLVRLIGPQLPLSGSPDRGLSGQSVLSKADLVKELESGRLYSKSRASAAVDEALAIKGEKIRDWIAGKWDDLTPAALGALTLRHLADIGGKLLPGIKDYLNTVHQMSAARNERAEAAGKFSRDVHEWARKNKAMANRLFDLMHNATIAGVDPSLPFVRLDMRQAGQAMDRYRDQLSKATCRRNQ